MLTRTAWKNLRIRKELDLPPGTQHACKCGGLIVLETGSSEVIVHHSEPHCTAFDLLLAGAEFVVLSAANKEAVDEALSVNTKVNL